MTVKKQAAGIISYALILSMEVTVFVEMSLEPVWHMPKRGIALGVVGSMILITIWVGRCIEKKSSYQAAGFTDKEKQWMRQRRDMYKRKMVVSFIICFAMMALSIGNPYCLLAGVFLACNSGVKQYRMAKLQGTGKQSEFYRYIKKLIWLSLLYWFAIASILLICFLLGMGMSAVNNLLVLAGIVDLIIFCWYFLSVRCKYCESIIKIHPFKKIVVGIVCIAIFLSFAMGMDSWWLRPYIQRIEQVKQGNCPITYDKKDGSYSITMQGEAFKILQLTDIHLTGSVLCGRKDIKALDAVYQLIQETKPDLVIITGDLVYPMGLFTFSVNNASPVKQFATFMEKANIPWAFVYGNHDTEAVATHDGVRLNQVLSQYSYGMFQKRYLYNGCQPDITGRNNQVIKILNQDGTVNQALFLLDSNSYLVKGGSDYDYIHDDQVEWYKEEVRKLQKEQGTQVSSLLFFHIPLQEYETAYEAYRKGDPSVTYYFGTMGEPEGKVSASPKETKLFEAVTTLKSTKAIFVGHDHYNNICLGYKGVRLTYGMSIDYVAIPGIAKDTEQRGGTLITLHKGSNFDISQIPLSLLA